MLDNSTTNMQTVITPGKKSFKIKFVENNLILYLLVCITTTIFAFLIEKIKEVVKNERK